MTFGFFWIFHPLNARKKAAQFCSCHFGDVKHPEPNETAKFEAKNTSSALFEMAENAGLKKRRPFHIKASKTLVTSLVPFFTALKLTYEIKQRKKPEQY